MTEKIDENAASKGDAYTLYVKIHETERDNPIAHNSTGRREYSVE